MTLLDLCQRLQDSAFATSLLESQYLWLILESAHVIGLSLSVGLIVITDLRLIGRFQRREPASDVLQQLRPWLIAGFALMFVTGVLLFISEAATVYTSPWFKLKLLFLLLAGINALWFELKLGRRLKSWSEQERPPLGAQIAGWTSLTCWTAVIVFGRWVAYAHT
jgi:uncharacterized membrane protein SirB2